MKPTPRPPTVGDDAATRCFLARHLGHRFGENVDIGAFERKSHGFSWVTYSFVARCASGGNRKLILRVAPPNGLFAPYSVLPQVYALQAMAQTRVPVPGIVSVAEDGAEIGFPFFVCEYIEGDVPAPWAAADGDEDERRRIATQFIEILAQIHSIDWKKTQLALLDGAANDAKVGHIRAWRASLARPTARRYPLLDWGGGWLEKNCPDTPRRTVVHGDYRIGNFLVREQKITAILDWELTHLGDPHEDLAWALMPTFNAGSRKFYGVIERQEFIDRYQAASGIAISARSLAFYEAYALYQAAAIQMRAIRAFEVDRFNDMRLAIMGTQMASILRALDRAIEAAS